MRMCLISNFPLIFKHYLIKSGAIKTLHVTSKVTRSLHANDVDFVNSTSHSSDC